MAIYRGVIHNGVIVPEVPLPCPEGTRVQILVSEREVGDWDEAFERIQKVAEMIAQSAPQTLNLGRLVEEGREELEKNVNASVSVKWVNPKEPLAHEAMLLLADFQKRKLRIIVPLFWCYEIANALRKAVSRGELTVPQAEMALDALLNLPVEVRPIPDPITAFKAALNFGCSI